MTRLRTAAGALIFLALSPSLVGAALAANRPNRAVVYYAAETTPQALASDIYAHALTALRGSRSPIAAALASSLVNDGARFPTSVDANVEALRRWSAQAHVDLYVFTNRLALQNSYWRRSGASPAFETLAWPAPRTRTASPILATSPLSDADRLIDALDVVGRSAPRGSLDIVLIVHAHGFHDQVLSPRLFAELTPQTIPIFLAAVESGHSDGQDRLLGAYRGTTKLQFWEALSSAAAAHDLAFPLVVRLACESGVVSWSELDAIPAAVLKVAHSGTSLIGYDAVDFGKLRPSGDVAETVGALMLAEGLRVDGRAGLARAMIEGWIKAAAPYALFAPLALWLGWWVASATKARRRRRAAA